MPIKGWAAPAAAPRGGRVAAAACSPISSARSSPSGSPRVSPGLVWLASSPAEREAAVRAALAAGNGIRTGNPTVARIATEMHL
jgi:hypothetical protein